MYKWVQPKICSEAAEGAVKLPPSGRRETCPPCNPGFFFANSSTCERCDHGSYSNGTGTEFRGACVLMYQGLFKCQFAGLLLLPDC